MIRADVVPAPFAEELNKIILEVLPCALYNHYGGDHVRETVGDIRDYNQKVMETLGRISTIPPISQDQLTNWPDWLADWIFKLVATQIVRGFSGIFGALAKICLKGNYERKLFANLEKPIPKLEKPIAKFGETNS